MQGEACSVFSAGVEPAAWIDPLAVKVMEEISLPLTGQSPKKIAELPPIEFQMAIPLSGEPASFWAPLLPPGTHIMSRRFDDPVTLSAQAVTEQGRLKYYRLIRDEIKNFLTALPFF